jgi:outer membrane protein assembly factor BamD (BamD/ComL family)
MNKRGTISGWVIAFILLFIISLSVLYVLQLRDWSLIIMALLLSSISVLVPWIGVKIAQLIGNQAGKILYSGEEFDRPQPMFSIPEGKRKSGNYQEAFDGFQKIASEYPQALKAYVAMIDIAIVDLKNKKLADSVFHQGIATLGAKEDRDSLARMYMAISSRLEVNRHVVRHPVELTKQSEDLSEPEYYR